MFWRLSWIRDSVMGVSETITDAQEKAREIQEAVDQTKWDLLWLKKWRKETLPTMFWSIKSSLFDLKNFVLWHESAEEIIAREASENKVIVETTKKILIEQPNDWSQFAKVDTSANLILQKKYEGEAWVKNNNPAWVTRGVSDALKNARDQAGITYKKWTPRPKEEKYNYVLFSSLQQWLQAMEIAMFRVWDTTIRNRLEARVWTKEWPSYARQILENAWFDCSGDEICQLTHNELTEAQKNDIIRAMIKKESPGLDKEFISNSQYA